jgi:hypothetical protein
VREPTDGDGVGPIPGAGASWAARARIGAECVHFGLISMRTVGTGTPLGPYGFPATCGHTRGTADWTTATTTTAVPDVAILWGRRYEIRPERFACIERCNLT